MAQKIRVSHPLEPVYDKNSKVIILGSFPSVKTRESGFFYGHPRNRFWKVLEKVIQEEVPQDIPGRRAYLLRHGIALWDVIAQCDIRGSSDASITNVHPTDLRRILEGSSIKTIFCNGKTSYAYFEKFQAGQLGRTAIGLPSTSPANAAYSLEDLTQKWSILKDYL